MASFLKALLVVGVLILGVVNNLLNMLSATETLARLGLGHLNMTHLQGLVKGAIIVAAVLVQRSGRGSARAATPVGSGPAAVPWLLAGAAADAVDAIALAGAARSGRVGRIAGYGVAAVAACSAAMGVRAALGLRGR